MKVTPAGFDGYTLMASNHMKRSHFAAALLLGAACGSPTGPATFLPLRVTAEDSTLALQNVSDQVVFYFVYERQAAALIDWAPCIDQSRCPSLAPAARATVPYTTIGGYMAGKTEAIVWWWYAVPGPADAPVPGPIGVIVVHL